MSFRVNIARVLLAWLMAVWLGGFTFYSTVVIPIIHEQLGDPLQTGLITQHATDVLNLIGVATVFVGWLLTAKARTFCPGGIPYPRISLALLFTTTVSLVFLVGLHRLLDAMLESSQLRGFYPWHRVYLWVSTAQWLVNMGLVACWTMAPVANSTRVTGENPQVSCARGDAELPA
jgi:hypothetical protein